jgi:hypothetical protein
MLNNISKIIFFLMQSSQRKAQRAAEEISEGVLRGPQRSSSAFSAVKKMYLITSILYLQIKNDLKLIPCNKRHPSAGTECF